MRLGSCILLCSSSLKLQLRSADEVIELVGHKNLIKLLCINSIQHWTNAGALDNLVINALNCINAT